MRDLNLGTNHVLVVGAGIIGLSVAYHLLKQGLAVSVVDRDPEGDKASFGNAGGIAVTEVIPASVPGLIWRVPGWLLDPLGPLAVRVTHVPRLVPWLWRFSRAGTEKEVARIAMALSALNGRVYDDLLPMLAATGLSGELQRKGALTVYETDQAFRKDNADWAAKMAHGVEVEYLTGAEVRDLEPALGPIVERGVFTPQWSHINDPRKLVDALRNWLLRQGVEYVAGDVVNVGSSGFNLGTVELSDGRKLSGGNVVIAAGAWSGLLANRLGDRVLLESERGYNTTIPESNVALTREVIFAERKFVATPLSCGLRIGGAAEFGGLDAVANFKRSEALVKLASLYLPDLKHEGGVNWAGHRPATPDSLPVIGRSRSHPTVFYAFGHGHLGLTQAATTGSIIGDLVSGRPTPIDVAPYSIDRFT